MAAVVILAGSGLALASETGRVGSKFVSSPGASHSTVGYLGIDVRDIGDDQMGALKLKDSRGAEIVKVDHDGPAGKCGLREHDVVLTMNGQMIEGEEQIRHMLHDLAPGRTVALVISRDGQTMNMNAQMGDRDLVERQAWEKHYKVDPDEPVVAPASEPASEGFSSGTGLPSHGAMSFLGSMSFRSASYTGAMMEILGPQLAGFFGVPGGTGLLVRSVENNSPAALAGMRAGDVAVRANSQKLSNNSDWMKTIKESKGRPVTVVVLRDHREVTLTLVPDVKRRSALERQKGNTLWACLTSL